MHVTLRRLSILAIVISLTFMPPVSAQVKKIATAIIGPTGALTVSATAVTSGVPITINASSLTITDAAATIALGVASDTLLHREAGNYWFQHNGTNAQRASWANTYTSATNYEAFSVDWQTTANVAVVGTRTAATGTGRVLRLYAQASSAGAGGGVFELSPTGGVLVSATAPSGPVACTTPTVTWNNGTATFQIDVGSTCAGISTLVVTLPAASNAWSCTAMNVTTSATAAVEMTASTTTSATFTNYTRTTGAALAWVDGADVRISCLGG